MSPSLFWMPAKDTTDNQAFVCVCVCTVNRNCILCVLHVNVGSLVCCVYMSVYLLILGVWKAAEWIGETHRLRSQTAWVQSLSLPAV